MSQQGTASPNPSPRPSPRSEALSEEPLAGAKQLHARPKPKQKKRAAVTPPPKKLRRVSIQTPPKASTPQPKKSNAEELVARIFEPERDNFFGKPYVECGNKQLYTPQNVAKREKLAVHPAVVASVARCVNVFIQEEEKLPSDKSQSGSPGNISKGTYYKIHRRMANLLRPGLSDVELLDLAEDDWNDDCDSKDGMSISVPQLKDVLFQFTDIWTENIDPTEYMYLLDTMVLKLTSEEGSEN